MTVAAIICLLIHDTINVVTVTTFGIMHRFDDGFTYSQAFWMTVCSTIVSVITTITLLLDYFCTPNFAKSGSGLTRKQRSAVIVFMVLLADLAIGGLVYCYLLELECVIGSLRDTGLISFKLPRFALFLSCVKLHYRIWRHYSKYHKFQGIFSVLHYPRLVVSSVCVLQVRLNLSGIFNTGLFIAVARSTIVESFEQSYRRRRHLMRVRKHKHQQEAARAKRGIHSAFAQMSSIARAGTGLTIAGVDVAAVRQDPSDGKADAEREAAAYEIFREEMAQEEKKEFRAKLWVSCLLFAAFWLVGAAIFMATEGWSYGIAIYFCGFP